MLDPDDPLDYVFFDVAYNPGQGKDEEHLGRIHMALYRSLAPATVKNFRTICNGNLPMKEQYINPLSRRPITHYTYRHTLIHRIIPGFMMQGGDITHLNGSGPSPSIFGGYFKDETFKIKFNRPFLLAMANNGQPDTNGSQWFITTAPAPHLNNTHVAFGEIFDSHSKQILKQLEKLGSKDGKIRNNGQVIIKNCGMVDPLLSNQLQKIHLQHGMCDVMVNDLYSRILKEQLGDDPLYTQNPSQQIHPMNTFNRTNGVDLIKQSRTRESQDTAFRDHMRQRAEHRQERQKEYIQAQQGGSSPPASSVLPPW